MAMPSQPALANSSKNSCGYSPVLSLVRQYSQSNLRARLRTSVRIRDCSSAKAKSIRILLQGEDDGDAAVMSTGPCSHGHYRQIAAWGSREKRLGWEQRALWTSDLPHPE